MSGSTKLWVDDTMYLVDDEVAEFIEQLQSQLAADQSENKWLHDALEVCEGCGNTTKIDDENYLLWCKTCWGKVVFENKGLREALEKIAGSNWLGNTRLTAKQALKGENEPDGKGVKP